MWQLVAVSLIWAFAPGIISTSKINALDPTGGAILGTVRLAFALLVFIPFFFKNNAVLAPRYAVLFAATGAVQFGVMQSAYIAAFNYLAPHEVFLFTIFTPIYVALFDAVLTRRFSPRWLIAAGIAAVAAAILLYRRPDSAGLLHGALLVQLSDICFAAGQIAYKHLRLKIAGSAIAGGSITGKPISDSTLFAYLLAGGVLASALLALAFAVAGTGGETTGTTGTAGITGVLSHFRPDLTQWLALGYLGIISSGLGYFLWNTGATRVNTGTLAVFNNLKIPLGVIISIAFFTSAPANASETHFYPRLALSIGLMLLALFATSKRTP